MSNQPVLEKIVHEDNNSINYAHITNLQNDIKNVVDNFLLSQIDQVLLKEFNFIDELRQEILLYYTNRKQHKHSLDQEIASRNNLLEKVSNAWLTPEPRDLSDEYPEFYEALSELINNLDETRVETQLASRFYSQVTDGWLLKISKFWKRFFYRFSTIPSRIKNLFRKEKKPLTFWKHTIPFRELANYYFRNLFIRDIQTLALQKNSKLAAIYLQIKLAEERCFLADEADSKDLQLFQNPGIEEMKNEISEEIRQSIHADIDDLIRRLIKDYQKSGTLELSNRHFKVKKVAREVAQAERLWNKTNYHWNNTVYALFEEWRTDLELYRLKYQAIAALEHLKTEQHSRLKDQVVSKIELIRAFIAEARNILANGAETNSKRLKKVLVQSKKQLDKNLVPDLVNAVSSRNFLNLINNLEHVIRTHIESISDDHVIAKTNEYNLPLSPNEISVTSPYELIAFELQSVFEDDLEDIKSRLLQEIEKATIVFRDIDHIIIFSISSALSVLDENNKENEALEIAMEGIDRADSRLTDGLNLLSGALNKTSDSLTTVLNEFNESLIKLTDNDSVFELKMRITKAKTLQQAEEVREKIKERFVQSKNRLFSFVTDIVPNISKSIQDFRARFNLTAKTQELSREMSDFLMESQSAMDKLPTIYRQLYKIEPLSDMELFEGRAEEVAAIQKSLESWEKGRFSSTVICGEKWGGQTSFINYLVNTNLNEHSLTRIALPKELKSKDSLFDLMKGIVKKPEIKSIEELIDELNDGHKRIIILEDIQHLFIRKIGGFEALNFLFHLISQTGINVFWLTSTTFYSWSYLEKTVRIHEYFSYIIKMAPFSNEQIKSIILKRNSISGFQIRFEPDSQQLANKKFSKLSPELQHESLEKDFFKELCDFAKSNVTMALLFWLLSTHKVDSRQITIGRFKRTNLNLLGALSADKIQILYALILHDGLHEDEISIVQHISSQRTKMILLSLVEDSIIIKNSAVYTLNPLIYRDAIAILKTKNLIQ